MRPPLQTLGIVFGVFCLLLLLERISPLRRRVSSVIQRSLINLGVSALAFLAAATVVRPVLMRTLDWSSSSSFGLLAHLHLPRIVQMLLGFVLLDLAFYWWHLAN